MLELGAQTKAPAREGSAGVSRSGANSYVHQPDAVLRSALVPKAEPVMHPPLISAWGKLRRGELGLAEWHPLRGCHSASPSSPRRSFHQADIRGGCMTGSAFGT